MYSLDKYRYFIIFGVGRGGEWGGDCIVNKKNKLYIYSHSWHIGLENFRLDQISCPWRFQFQSKIFFPLNSFLIIQFWMKSLVWRPRTGAPEEYQIFLKIQLNSRIYYLFKYNHWRAILPQLRWYKIPKDF